MIKCLYGNLWDVDSETESVLSESVLQQLFVDRWYHTTPMDILDLIHFDFEETVNFNREKSKVFAALMFSVIFLAMLHANNNGAILYVITCIYVRYSLVLQN